MSLVKYGVLQGYSWQTLFFLTFSLIFGHSSLQMDSDVVFNCRYFRKFRDGSVVLYRPNWEKVPAVDDPESEVRSKDVEIMPEIGISARIFLPKSATSKKKLPLLFHVHGGGFCMLSPFAPPFHKFCTLIASLADVIIVSVDYRLFPGRPITACYDDSWEALLWTATHAHGSGPDPWLNEHADFGRVFIGGDSAGANITHTLVNRVGKIGLPARVKTVGAVLIHPFFGGTKDDEMWMVMCPDNNGLDDPRLSPPMDDLAMLGCEKMLIFVAEKDELKEPGKSYYEKLKKSGWKGKVEMVDNFGEEHCFHIRERDGLAKEEGKKLIQKYASFLNQD